MLADGQGRQAAPCTRKPGFWGTLVFHWPTIRRVLLCVFVLAVVVMLAMLGRAVDWAEVYAAMRNTKPEEVLAMAVGFVALSYGLYSSYEVLGRRYTGHDLTHARTVLICLINYAFNLSLGTLVVGMGFRYRLYSQHGIDAATTTRILGLSLATNWMGYFMLGGLVFASSVVSRPGGTWGRAHYA